MANVKTDLTREQLIEAAVAVVRDIVANAMAGKGRWSDGLHMSDQYVASDSVTSAMKRDGLLVETPNTDDYYGRELARQAAERKTKRALDAEAAKPDARILRFSSRDNKFLPLLNGERRRLYGQQVAYTTPEFYAKAQAAAEALRARQEANVAEFDALLDRARAAGLTGYERKLTSIHFDLDATRKLVALLER